MRKEYDFRGSKPNPYVKRLGEEGRKELDRRFLEAEGFVRLDDEVAAAFPSSDTVNEALRLVLKLRKVGAKPRKATPKAPRAKKSA
jgi:hypothetical protein